MKIFSPKIKNSNFLPRVFLFLLVLIIPFVYTLSTLDPSLAPRYFALSLLLLLFGITIFYYSLKSSKDIDFGIFSKTIFKVYLIYILVAAISIAFAYNKSEAIFEWFKTVTFFVLFCLLTISLLNGKLNYIFLIKLIVIYSIIISLWGFYEIFTISSLKELDHQSSYFIRAFSSNRNLYSQILFLTLPFCLFGIYRLKSGWRVLSIISSIFVLVLVTILLTRSVWIAILVSFFFSASVLFLFRKSFSLNRKGVKIVGLSLFAGILIVVAGIFMYSKFGEAEVFKKQTLWVGNYKYGSTLERIDLWENTLKMSLDHPITGVGPGNWRIEFPAYGLENLRSETGEIFFQRPHNDFLWVLSENGVFGLVSYLLLFLLAYYYLFQIIKKSPSTEKKYLALALIYGLTGYLMISFFSFPKERIEHQIYLCIIFAIALTEYYVLNPDLRRLKKGIFNTVFIIFLILTLVGCYLSFSRLISELSIAEAYEYREKQQWKNEIKSYKQAETFITEVDAFSTPLSWYIGEAWFNLNKIDSAHYYFQKAYKTNPYHLHVLNNLGTTFELKGQSDKAELLFIKAHDIAPRFEDPVFNLCAIYFNEGNFDKAYKMIRNIDQETKNSKYEKFLKVILWRKIDQVSQQFSDRTISKSILRIRNDDEWTQKVHKQSIEKGTELEKQLLLEVIYLLESVDSTININEAAALKKKFNLL